jgi:acyl carrier protein
MTHQDIQKRVLEALASVAPEIDTPALDTRAPLRDQVDIDSMDFLRFVVELHRQFGIDVPEADYQKLSNVDSVTEYVAARTGAAPSSR